MKKSVYLDMDLCAGCGACVVACMDQNDIYPEKNQPAFRRIYKIEGDGTSDQAIRYISASCMHCEDSPCVTGCPTGAIARDDSTGAVSVNKALCIGCHSCAMSCPFGVPRYDQDDKMQKCSLCAERIEAGMEPACVRVCPFGALKFESVNKIQDSKESAYITRVGNTVQNTGTGK